MGLSRAFFEWRPTREAAFVGLENFSHYLLHYPESGREFANVARFLVYSLFAHVGMPFVMAELIFAIRSATTKEFYRFLVVLPMLVPQIVAMLLWSHIYDPGLGPLNDFLEAVGLDILARDWLGDPKTALYAIMAVNFPWVASIGTLIFLGGLSQISSSVFDSCLLDGCSWLRGVVSMDLPLVMGQVRLLVILAMLGATQSFQIILVLTRGGPGYVTSVPGMTMYTRAFNTGQFGYASAIGLLLFILGLALIFLINKTLRPHYQ
ncbi:MAG: sugar ABC transporter permease [Acidimicrobiales bacterium]|nr:sugar ABC transporter permease [Acidimicrobiales bacterium]